MKNKTLWVYSFLLVFTVLFLGCKSNNENEPGLSDEKAISSTSKTTDPLPSWNEGNTKKAIIDYVNDITNESSNNFIPVEDRIATFDNDGTLWSEQPAYFQLFFAIDRIKGMAEDHPEWKDQQPYKAILDNDMEAFSKQGMKGVVSLIMTTHANLTTEEFEKAVSDWMATAKHPKTGLPYNEMIYQPMLELLKYLRDNHFKTFIVSGGGIEFMRPWAEKAYGIPKDQIIGSSIKTTFEMTPSGPIIKRLPELDFIDDKEGKPVAINKFIGRKPVFVAGNSDGDLQMMQWADSNTYKSCLLYIHHTDSIREYAYDRGSHIGGFDKGWDQALEKGWLISDMAQDWKVIYPSESTK